MMEEGRCGETKTITKTGIDVIMNGIKTLVKIKERYKIWQKN